MPIVGFVPIPRGHFCAEGRPNPFLFKPGTIWECTGCSALYRVEIVRDRSISAREWVSYTGEVPNAT